MQGSPKTSSTFSQLCRFDNSSVESLTEAFHEKTRLRLIECRIGNCQSMKNIFDASRGDIVLECLEVMWVSALPQLTTVCHNYNFGVNLAFLKHIHLERCPKLLTVLEGGCHIESLETLEIKFCGRLEEMFGHKMVTTVFKIDPRSRYKSSSAFPKEVKDTLFPRLRSSCLWDLPKLKNIENMRLPKLQKMRVRGCRNLRKLPFRVHVMDDDHSPYDASDVGNLVEIEGEMHWWNNLRWANEYGAIELPICFRPWRPVLAPQRK